MLLELYRDGMQAHKEFCCEEVTHMATGWEVPQKGNSQAEERQQRKFSLKACRALAHKQLVAQLREWQWLEWEGPAPPGSSPRQEQGRAGVPGLGI